MEIAIRRAAVDDAESVMELINSIIEEGGLTSIYPRNKLLTWKRCINQENL